jgi:uncharacterized membrane protein YphA (DoxX/SURF4 family)
MNEMRSWIKSHADLVIDAMRIYLGVGLFFKGIYFMQHRDEMARLMDQLGNLWFVPLAIEHYVAPMHIVGGALLAAGLLTRVAALSQIPTMLGAVLYVHLPKALYFEPRQSLEFSVLVLFLLCLIFVYGAGRFSVDYVLTGKKKIEPRGVPAAI